MNTRKRLLCPSPRTASASRTCPPTCKRKPSDVSALRALKHLPVVCDAADKKHNLDKEVATEIRNLIAADPDLGDETAGWHVIVGKSFAASITYNTKYLIFFDLMEGCPKSFMLFKTV